MNSLLIAVDKADGANEVGFGLLILLVLILLLAGNKRR